MTTRQLASIVSLALSACTVIADDTPECTDGKCDGGGVSQTCKDQRYGDGTCNLDLQCSVPDIDCFRTFATDAEASAWWMTAQTTVGQNFPIIADTDPRFATVRDALDKGWAAFKAHRPVGKLADKRPALVLVDKPMIQNAAFVFGDRAAGNQPFVVMVEAPALVGAVDSTALLGVMMHELQHAVGLHKLGDVSDKLRKFYVAPEGTEPFGREQADDANLRMLGEAWRTAASQIGPYSQAELGGLPFAGDFFQMLSVVAGQAAQAHPAECSQPVQALDAAQTAARAGQDLLDDSLTADLSTVGPAITDALVALRDQCLPNFPYGVIEVGASIAMVTPAQFEAQLDPHDVALVKGKHFIDGLTAIVEDRRATMRDAETKFQTATGQAWTQLRYFSYEEDADDVSTIVMRAAHLDPAAMSKFFFAVLPEATATACHAKLETGLPGYGVDLVDEHHATCWRAGHQQREASAARTLARPATAATIRIPGRIPAAPNPADQIAY